MENGCKVTSKPKSVREYFITWYFWKPFLGVLAGIIAGFLYYHFVESSTGSWSLTGDTYRAMFFGSVLGFFVTSSPCSVFGR